MADVNVNERDSFMATPTLNSHAGRHFDVIYDVTFQYGGRQRK